MEIIKFDSNRNFEKVLAPQRYGYVIGMIILDGIPNVLMNDCHVKKTRATIVADHIRKKYCLDIDVYNGGNGSKRRYDYAWLHRHVTIDLDVKWNFLSINIMTMRFHNAIVKAIRAAYIGKTVTPITRSDIIKAMSVIQLPCRCNVCIDDMIYPDHKIEDVFFDNSSRFEHYAVRVVHDGEDHRHAYLHTGEVHIVGVPLEDMHCLASVKG